jgi:hypothetical protein
VRALRFADGTEIEARTVLIATGVSYRMLEASGLEEFRGRGVYYGATANEARAVEGEDVYIVRAANSAGQAVLNCARFARKVVLLVPTGHTAGGRGPCLRTVLHDEGRREGHRPRPRHLTSDHRRSPSRSDRDRRWARCHRRARVSPRSEVTWRV